jgi:hypothetical protein
MGGLGVITFGISGFLAAALGFGVGWGINVPLHTLLTFSSSFQSAVDATHLTFSSILQHVLDAALLTFWSSFQYLF